MTTQQEPRTVMVKPYTLTDLSIIYGVCRKTIKGWIYEFKDEIGEKKGRYYSIKQVKTIFENLNIPYKMILD